MRWIDTLAAIATPYRLPALPMAEEVERSQAIAQYWQTSIGRLHRDLIQPVIRFKVWFYFLSVR